MNTYTLLDIVDRKANLLINQNAQFLEQRMHGAVLNEREYYKDAIQLYLLKTVADYNKNTPKNEEIRFPCFIDRAQFNTMLSTLKY